MAPPPPPLPPSPSGGGVSCAIEGVPAAGVRPLRHAVLRPGQPAERLVYPGDDDESSLHLAVRDRESVVSVASFYLEALPERVEVSLCGLAAGTPGLRIRGMATEPAHRSKGFGRALVDHGLRAMCAQHLGVRAAWCNARTTASGYYERVGFVVASRAFEMPDIGPHVVMVRGVDAPA